MIIFPRAARHFALFLPLALLAHPLPAQDVAEERPASLQSEEETPWLYEGSNVPVDRAWLFGELDNGLRYAVRRNGVPPEQVSIRIRIDAGSLHERDEERGFAHLLEHLLFRESKYLGPAQAIPTWQRLGATFGSDTNAVTSPTQTVYKLDLPEANPAKLEESFKLLSGMVREPVINDANLAAEVPIVMAEKRERGGPAQRVGDARRATLFAGQRLAERSPIGTVETLSGAKADAVDAFHKRWYRPENAVIVVAGDADPVEFARLIEEYFNDWQGQGEGAEAPDFGDPVAPAGADAANPVGETAVLIEPDLPRSYTYAIMRPWRPVQDTIVYNEGLLMDALSQALINRRLEKRARGGGSFLYAQVQQDDVSRSADATFVNFAPLTDDWQAALKDVRSVIADALSSPPTAEEIAREVAEFDVAFKASVDEAPVAPGARLADNLVDAVDIRETTAAPETVLDVFRNMQERVTPAAILARTRALFEGDVIRSVYVTPSTGEAGEDDLRTALLEPVTADSSARLAASNISFEDLPPIGEPGVVAQSGPLGILGIEQVQFANGVRAMLWPNDAEPGRVAVKVRFGSGYRGFGDRDAPYVLLGEMALVGSGVGELGQEELDRIATGRKLGFDFKIDDAVFTFEAQTRGSDLADQLYLFAAKLGMPRWDPNPIIRAQAASRLAYESYATSPGGLLSRDLDYLLRDRDPRFATPTPEMMAQTTPEGFREVWEPLLAQGPVEVMIFGEFNRDETLEALRKTFGALPERSPIPAEAASRTPGFPSAGDTTVLKHRGDANQAAAVISWPSGGGVANIRESRQIEILTQLFMNRLMDEMRERAGASYAPQVSSDWPVDLEEGGTITAFAQLKPEDVPTFFAAAESIASDIANNPPSADELNRVTEPLRQLISRASTGNGFWMFQLEGATYDSRRVAVIRSLLNDYSQTTPEAMQALARRYLASRPGYRLAVIPEGQELAKVSTFRAQAVGR
ncbi:M16 family metallopeptidase [Parerythrobacter jejuensis]|uniref:Insulinase family protein n=1 Tax=Parerythrobacter jejuensis TaxID=795812 RepID=A0A845AVH6_9SPHN|nr:insulinase family protein [Parerythrobacter jejuensis]MXP32801.1 insulinase family protein [Parerythrobacter jejuensis]